MSPFYASDQATAYIYTQTHNHPQIYIHKWIQTIDIRQQEEEKKQKADGRNMLHLTWTTVLQSNRYSYQILMKINFSHRIFEKYSNIKFHDNRSSCSPAVHVDRRTDGTKDLIVAFRNFVKAPKNNDTASA